MGFLSNGVGLGIGQGLAQGADNFTRMLLWGRERQAEDERRRQQQAYQDAMLKISQDAALRQQKIYEEGQLFNQGLQGLMAPRQEALPVLNQATGQPIQGAVGGPTKTVYPEVGYRQISALPGATPERTMPFYQAEQRDEAQRAQWDALKERLMERLAAQKEMQEYKAKADKELQDAKFEAAMRLKQQPSVRVTVGGGGGASGSGRGGAYSPSDDQVEVLAQMLASGEVAPSQLSKRSGLQQAVFTRAKQINPNLNLQTQEINYKGKSSMQAITAGQLVNATRPLITSLKASYDRLNMGNTQPLNAAKAYALEKLGNKDIAAFNMYKTKLVEESERLLQGAGAMADERVQRNLALLKSSLSPRQMEGAISALDEILATRHRAVQGNVVDGQNTSPSPAGSSRFTIKRVR